MSGKQESFNSYEKDDGVEGVVLLIVCTDAMWISFRQPYYFLSPGNSVDFVMAQEGP
jgi:hypothetical protein